MSARSWRLLHHQRLGEGVDCAREDGNEHGLRLFNEGPQIRLQDRDKKHPGEQFQTDEHALRQHDGTWYAAVVSQELHWSAHRGHLALHQRGDPHHRRLQSAIERIETLKDSERDAKGYSWKDLIADGVVEYVDTLEEETCMIDRHES